MIVSREKASFLTWVIKESFLEIMVPDPLQQGVGDIPSRVKV